MGRFRIEGFLLLLLWRCCFFLSRASLPSTGVTAPVVKEGKGILNMEGSYVVIVVVVVVVVEVVVVVSGSSEGDKR